jgi:hypothetical protein
MVLWDRTEQADFFFPLRSCALFSIPRILRDEPVGLRREESLFLFPFAFRYSTMN